MTETIDRPTTTTRPLIRFDDRDIDRSTARRYANDLISRVNRPETNEILGAVADGCEVDAYRLAEATLDAMRHVSTRFGQSTARRRAGEKAAHLGYIAHSVLSNHANDLPVYEGGPRSPRIAELELEVEHAGVVNQQLSADLVGARRELARERSQFLNLKSAANNDITRLRAEITRLGAEAERLRAELAQAEADRDEVGTVLNYLFEAVDGPSRQRVLGFWDGLEVARS